jgi:proteasome lid subunit RPN8/RPN11
VWQQIQAYTKACSPDEITSIGMIDILSSRELIVPEIFIPEQKVSPGFSNFKEGALNKIVFDALRAGKNTALMNFRWHSHGTGSVFFSGTDLRDIEEWKGDWVVNLVTNIYGKHIARIDMFKPFRITMEIKVVIDYQIDPAVQAACNAVVSEKVERVKPLLAGLEEYFNDEFF